MKLFVPEIGTVLTLASDWEFSLYTERRNESLAVAAGFNYHKERPWNMRAADTEVAASDGWLKAKSYYDWYRRVTLPSGTILKLDRIYIRKGVSDFSSLSFNLERASVNPDFSAFAKNLNTMKGKCRFWAKLADVNTIEFVD
jgi:hypothetical protein